MGEQEVIMTKLALSVTLVALAALTASSTSSAPRAAWNPSADVAALLQTSADTAGEVKLSPSGAATYAMGIPQTGPGGYGTLPSATIPGSLPPANHPPVLGSPLLYGKDYVTPVNSARAQYPRTQWYSWPIVQAAWVTTNWYKMSTQMRKDQIAALKFHAEEADKNAVKIREARLKVVRKLIENTKAQISALSTLREEVKHPSKARAPPHPINPYTTLPSAPATPVNTQVDALARLQQQEDYMVQFLTSQVHISNTIEAGHAAAEKGYIDALEAKYADENKAESDHVSLVVKEAKQQQADIVRKTKQEQKMLKDELAVAAGEGDAQADDESQSTSKASNDTSSSDATDSGTNDPSEASSSDEASSSNDTEDSGTSDPNEASSSDEASSSNDVENSSTEKQDEGSSDTDSEDSAEEDSVATSSQESGSSDKRDSQSTTVQSESSGSSISASEESDGSDARSTSSDKSVSNAESSSTESSESSEDDSSEESSGSDNSKTSTSSSDKSVSNAESSSTEASESSEDDSSEESSGSDNSKTSTSSSDK